jgi:hypothetical protein
MKTKLNTIIAVTALTVAVVGSPSLGHAAARFVLPKTSVGSGQLKTNAVTAPRSRNGTLTAAKFKAGQLHAGPPGRRAKQVRRAPPGPQGPKGERAIKAHKGRRVTRRPWRSGP